MFGSSWTRLGGTSAARGNPGYRSPAGVPASGGAVDIDGGSEANAVTLTGTELRRNTINLSNAGVIDFSNRATLDGLSTVTGADGSIGVSGANNGFAGYINGGTLYVLGGTSDNQEVHVNGGDVDVMSALEGNDALSIDGGTLEIAQQSTVSPSRIAFINANAATSAARAVSPKNRKILTNLSGKPAHEPSAI